MCFARSAREARLYLTFYILPFWVAPKYTDLHRPQCLGGYKDKYTRKLYFNTSTEAINSTDTFECHKTGYRQVEYRKYKACFTNLYIPSLAYVTGFGKTRQLRTNIII